MLPVCNVYEFTENHGSRMLDSYTHRALCVPGGGLEDAIMISDYPFRKVSHLLISTTISM